MLTQGEEGGKSAGAPRRGSRHVPTSTYLRQQCYSTHLTHLRQPSEAAWQIFGVNAAAWQIILVNVAAWQPARAVCVTFVIKSLLVLLHVLFNLYYLLLLK